MPTSEASFCRFIVCAAFLINVSARRVSEDLQRSLSSVSKATDIATDIASKNQAIIAGFVPNSTDGTLGDVEVVFRCPYRFCSECCASDKITNGFECILRNEATRSWPRNRGCTTPQKRNNTEDMTVHCSNIMVTHLSSRARAWAGNMFWGAWAALRDKDPAPMEPIPYAREVSRPETMPKEQCASETQLQREDRLLKKYNEQKTSETQDAQTREVAIRKMKRGLADDDMDLFAYMGIEDWMVDQQSLVTMDKQKVPLENVLLIHPVDFIGAIEKTVVRAREVREKIFLFEKDGGEQALDEVTVKHFVGMFSTQGSVFLFANLGTNFDEDGDLLPLEEVPDKVMNGKLCTNCRYVAFEGNGRVTALRWGLAGTHLFNDLQIEAMVWSFPNIRHERMSAELLHTGRLLGGVEKFSLLRVPEEVLDAPAEDEALRKVQTWGRGIADVLDTHVTEAQNWAELLQLTGGLNRKTWFHCFSGYKQGLNLKGCPLDMSKCCNMQMEFEAASK